MTLLSHQRILHVLPFSLQSEQTIRTFTVINNGFLGTVKSTSATRSASEKEARRSKYDLSSFPRGALKTSNDLLQEKKAVGVGPAKNERLVKEILRVSR